METADEVIEALHKILVRDFELDPAQLVPDARLREDLELDSLDAADLLIGIEKKYEIRIEEDDARLFKTVGDVQAHVRKLVDAKRANAGAS